MAGPPIIPSLSSPQIRVFQTLAWRLKELGFTEATVAEALHIPHLSLRRQALVPAYARRLRRLGGLGVAISFWLLHEEVEQPLLRNTLGGDVVDLLDSLGWLEVSAGKARSCLDLYPCAGLYILSDTAFDFEAWPQRVSWLGPDSYGLAYCTPRQWPGRALHLCSGSGVQALLGKTQGHTSLGVDDNPRAACLGRLNAQLNGLPEVDFATNHSDSEPFDLITLNPPFVPTPAHASLVYRSGGPGGHAVSQPVLSALPGTLQQGGLFSMVTEATGVAGHTPLRSFQQWLGDPPTGWGVAVLPKRDFPLNSYILTHVLATSAGRQDPDAELERWLDAYQSQQITSVVACQLLVVRLNPGSPSWSWEHSLAPPRQPCWELIQDWLESLQTWHSPWPQDFQPRLHPQVRSLHLGSAGVWVDFVDDQWNSQAVRYGPDHAAVLQRLGQAATLAEIQHSLPGSETILRELGAELILTRPPGP